MIDEMPKDIVKELHIRATIEQISGTLFERAANEIEQLRKERDEARLQTGRILNEIDAVDVKTVRPDIRLDLKNLNEMMNAKGEIDVLRKAGYFQDGEDALSLLAGVDSLKMDLESATKFANACAASAEAMTKKIADLESKVAVLESRIRSMGGSV